MATVGGGNPIPFEIGGGPSTAEAIYFALRDSVGKGGSAPDGTIEASWRWARARGLNAAVCDGRAAKNYFPDRCADSLETYEEILQLSSDLSADLETRRSVAAKQWIGSNDISVSGLVAELQAIDSRFSALTNDLVSAGFTVHGRAFEDWNPAGATACGPDFGGRDSSAWPNYSSEFNFLVRLSLSATELTAATRHIIETAKSLLNELLPAWVNYKLTRTIVGFELDTDLLDLEGFGP